MDHDKPVGYCNPPRDTRFRKGKSGNPKGRPPRAKLTEALAFEQACTKRVWVTENKKRKRLTMRQVIDKRLIQKAGEGELKAIHMVYERQERLLRRKELGLELELEDPPTEAPRLTVVFRDPIKRED